MRSGDAARALRILGGLQAEGAEPPLVLWALLRELRAQAARRRRARGRAPAVRAAGGARRARRPHGQGPGAGDAWDELALLAVELTGLRTLPLVRAGARR